MKGQVWRIVTMFIVAAVINSMMVFVPVPQVAFAAPQFRPVADIDDLPEDGWELTDYICNFEGCDPESDDSNDWPVLFEFHTDEDGGHTVKAECTQPGVQVPDIGTKFHREGDLLKSDEAGVQNTFRIIEILEPPKPKLDRFTVECNCTKPGEYSDEITIRVKAIDKDDDGFEGADVRIFIGDELVASGETGGEGNFKHTQVARNLIGATVKVEVEDLDPQTFTITDELFAPCTGSCDNLSGAYDKPSDTIAFTMTGSQPGWPAVIRNVTLGASDPVCQGVLDGIGQFACSYLVGNDQWGTLLFKGEVDNAPGVCEIEVKTPGPFELKVTKDCPTHGEDSRDMVWSIKMVDEDGDVFTKLDKVHADLPNGDSFDIPLTDGKSEEMTFKNAKKYVGEEVILSWAQGGRQDFTIDSEIFDPCKSPTKTPTPPPTPRHQNAGNPNDPIAAGTEIPGIEPNEAILATLRAGTPIPNNDQVVSAMGASDAPSWVPILVVVLFGLFLISWVWTPFHTSSAGDG